MTTGEMYARARALAEVQRYDAALELLDRLVATAPDEAAVHHLRSVCLRLTDRPEEALQAAEAAVAVDPELAGGHQARAQALLQMTGGGPLAVAAAEQAVRLDPHSVAGRETLGNALLACGDADGAVLIGAGLVRSDPGSPAGRLLLGRAALLRREHDAAEEHLTAVLGLRPDCVLAMLELAVLEQRRRCYDAAAQWLARVAALEPDRDSAVSVGSAMVSAVEQRLVDGYTPAGRLALLDEALGRAEGAPPFVAAGLRMMLAVTLRRAPVGDPVANVLRAVGLADSVHDLDAGTPVPPPDPSPTPGDAATTVLRELQAALWLGGERLRRTLLVQWALVAAETHLLAVPVAGRRDVHTAAAVAAAEQSLARSSGQPVMRAQAHAILGHALQMRQDGDRTAHLHRAVEQLQAALELLTRFGVLAMRGTIEHYLAGALMALDPDQAARYPGSARDHLARALELTDPADSPAGHAVVLASLGEWHLQRMRAYGDRSDGRAAVEHLLTAAAIMDLEGRKPAQASFLLTAARAWALRPPALAGQPEGDPEQVADLVQEAATLVTRASAPLRWAMARSTAAAVSLLRAPDPRRAAGHVRAAREADAVADPAADPRDWAQNRFTLARVLAHHARPGTPDGVAALREAASAVVEVLPTLVDLLDAAERAEAHVHAARVLRAAGDALDEPALRERAAAQLAAGEEQARRHGFTRILSLAGAERAAAVVPAQG